MDSQHKRLLLHTEVNYQREKPGFYFPSLNTEKCAWIGNPFMENSSDFNLI